MIGVLLAGGSSRRFGAPKALARLHGRPLAAYPLAALRDALPPDAALAVLAKRGTPLPPLPVPTWHEPDEPHHPLCGLREALRRAQGADLLVCAVDMPLITAGELRVLLGVAAKIPAPAVLPLVEGRVQPLCGVWRAAAAGALERAPDGVALHELARSLGAHLVERPDPRPYLNVNTPADLERAQLA